MLLFLIGIVAVMFYATAISDTVGLIQNPVLPRNEAIVVFMLTIATLISITCKIDTSEVLNASTFKSGMSACVCVLGVAWLGDTFVKAHISDIQTVAGDLLHNYPWLLAVVLFFAATLLYSPLRPPALMPAALMLGVTPLTAIASLQRFPPCSCCQPTQPCWPQLRWMTPAQPVSTCLTTRSSSRAWWRLRSA